MKITYVHLVNDVVYELMTKQVCGPHHVVDKPCISLSDTLGPAMLADQDLVITKSSIRLKWHLGPRLASRQGLGVR